MAPPCPRLALLARLHARRLIAIQDLHVFIQLQLSVHHDLPVLEVHKP